MTEAVGWRRLWVEAEGRTSRSPSTIGGCYPAISEGRGLARVSVHRCCAPPNGGALAAATGRWSLGAWLRLLDVGRRCHRPCMGDAMSS
uniref:Predicted protein n=1 Tax=Hordeum vulgare subsp. vulgare TaxID=112509 RepID=F2EI85_HORVV|nr:predicted protein [Hordeum vulgare subsp. vulgare]